MRAYLGRRYRFPASHRLHCAALTDGENQATYGKCNNAHGHGHNYTLEVLVAGEVDAVTGMVCDLVALDNYVAENVLQRFDHANLNLDSAFADAVPTSENLCLEIQRIFSASFTLAELAEIRLEETRKNTFEYRGGKADAGAPPPGNVGSRG